MRYLIEERGSGDDRRSRGNKAYELAKITLRHSKSGSAANVHTHTYRSGFQSTKEKTYKEKDAERNIGRQQKEDKLAQEKA